MKKLFQKFLYIIIFLFSYVSTSAECETTFQNPIIDILTQTKGSRLIEWAKTESGFFEAIFAGRILTMSNDVIVVEFFNPRGELNRDEIYKEDFHTIKASARARTQFEWTENNPLEKVNLLNIPSRTHQEKLLREQGLEEQFITGLDTAHYIKQLGQALIKAKINPFFTHIENFSQDINFLFQYIRRGIELQNEYVAERLAILKILKQEARLKRSRDAVTYAWWLSLNERLSIVASPFSGKMNPKEFTENNYKVSLELAEVLQLFPDVVVIPTIHGQSPFSLNRFAFQGVAPAELANHEKIADGEKHSPAQLFGHDLLHAIFGFGRRTQQQEVIVFHNHFMNTVENLPIQRRQKSEIIYSILTHESKSNDKIQLSDFTEKENIVKLVKTAETPSARFTKYNDLGYQLFNIDRQILQTPKDPKTERLIKRELDNMIKVFHKVAVRIAKTME